jgi:cytoskeletal protein CcmA (bactofilin family)
METTHFSGDRTAPSAPKPSSSTRNVLSSDVEIKGTVKFQHDLIVDGKIEGDIQSTGNLTIGENARIKAEVRTGSVIVYGKIHGNLTAVERVELKSSAEVVGDIKAKVLTIDAGAIFVGKSTVGTPTQVAPSQPELKPIANQAAAAVTQPLLAEK